MTASIPNGFSSDDLERLLDSARQDITDAKPSGEGPYGDAGLTQSELEALAEKFIDESLEDCNDPMYHKLIVITLIYRFATWHTKIGEQCFEKGQTASGACWLRDAGKFQSMLDSLMSIQIGEDDFTCVHTQE